MIILDIAISNIIISESNVRKTMSKEKDEVGIKDLANDIDKNGLINPITVRRGINNIFEVVAGQRRFLAMKYLKKTHIPCNIITVNTQQAEEISLVENVQRNQMTTCDKIRAYSRLYNFYNKDINKVVSAIHITKATIQKYLKISLLPSTVLDLLDKKGKERISIDIAIELTRLPSNVDLSILINKISLLTSKQKIETIKTFRISDNHNIDNLDKIKKTIVTQPTKINILQPFVPNNKTGKIVNIPEFMYDDIVCLIENRLSFIL